MGSVLERQGIEGGVFPVPRLFHRLQKKAERGVHFPVQYARDQEGGCQEENRCPAEISQSRKVWGKKFPELHPHGDGQPIFGDGGSPGDPLYSFSVAVQNDLLFVSLQLSGFFPGNARKPRRTVGPA